MEDSKASIKGYLASGKYPITGIKIFRFEVMVRVLVWELQALQKILNIYCQYIDKKKKTTLNHNLKALVFFELLLVHKRTFCVKKV